MQIIPDKLILLEVEDELSIDRVKQSMTTDDNHVTY
jgi:hypothetical protein